MDSRLRGNDVVARGNDDWALQRNSTRVTPAQAGVHGWVGEDRLNAHRHPGAGGGP